MDTDRSLSRTESRFECRLPKREPKLRQEKSVCIGVHLWFLLHRYGSALGGSLKPSLHSAPAQ